MGKKKRAPKTISPQYELFLKELENNVEFRNKHISRNSYTADETWEGLVVKLNACGGPQRPVDAWKRIMSDWTRRKLKSLKVASDGKLPDLELRLIKVTGVAAVNSTLTRKDLVQSPKSKELHEPIIIENNDNIEVVDEEGTIISSWNDKLEFVCEGATPGENNIGEQELQGTPASKQESNTPVSGLDMLLGAFKQNKQAETSFREEILTELKGIRRTLEKQHKELRVQNEIGKLRARIEYEKIRAKYERLNL